MLCSGSAGFDGVATSGLLAILAIASASAIMGLALNDLTNATVPENFKADTAACDRGEVEGQGTASERIA
jgi:hypothetical protein